MSGVRKITPEDTFYDYFTTWVADYKEGVIRDVTLQKYKIAIRWVGRLVPDLKLKDIDRATYQKILNAYAKEHERQTHASILLGEGATIASIAMRLGHSSMATTQKVYLHVIAELEAKDNNIIIGAMSGL